MTEAPKRIQMPRDELMFLTDREMEDGVAYVRADIADAILAALKGAEWWASLGADAFRDGVKEKHIANLRAVIAKAGG